ncbi:hypothetical protein EDB89DRAFT_1911817 [Lactarius sanguifluus]|nr:hypothetical protein EDB89DRAFT_1911817 [Lactarius sanguifluus]
MTLRWKFASFLTTTLWVIYKGNGNYCRSAVRDPLWRAELHPSATVAVRVRLGHLGEQSMPLPLCCDWDSWSALVECPPFLPTSRHSCVLVLLGRLALDPPRWWPWVACAHRAARHLEWLVRGGAAAAVNRRQMPCERVPAVQRRQNSWGGVLWRLRGSGVSEAAAWWSQGATKKKGRGSRRKTREYAKVYIQDSYLVDPTAHLFSPHSKRPGRPSAATSLHWQVTNTHLLAHVRKAFVDAAQINLTAAPPRTNHSRCRAARCAQATHGHHRGGSNASRPSNTRTQLWRDVGRKGGHSTNADHESQSQQSGSGVLCSPKCPSRTLTATVAEGWSSARQSGSRTALLQ